MQGQRVWGGEVPDTVEGQSEQLVACLRRDKTPRLNSFCYMASISDSNFVHILLDYMTLVHGGPIYPDT